MLEDGIKDSCYENLVTFAEKCPWESILEEVTLYIGSRFFFFFFFFESKRLAKYDFLEIYEIFNVANSTNLGC